MNLILKSYVDHTQNSKERIVQAGPFPEASLHPCFFHTILSSALREAVGFVEFCVVVLWSTRRSVDFASVRSTRVTAMR